MGHRLPLKITVENGPVCSDRFVERPRRDDLSPAQIAQSVIAGYVDAEQRGDTPSEFPFVIKIEEVT